MRSHTAALAALAALIVAVPAGRGRADATKDVAASPPNVLFVTIDTLRSDHVSAYGYARSTTPNLDRWIAEGVRFDQARTVEPLTGPALTSMLTARQPQDHGATRNGLRMRTGLASLPKSLQARGYVTAAFVGNWTLRDKLCGLAEHFESYEEVLTRKRWWGLVRREADGEDLTDTAIEWIDGHATSATGAPPFFLWVHYVEPHAPYRAHDEFRAQLGLPERGDLSQADRYDTEIAFADASVGRLLDHLKRRGLDERTIIVFLADHGESLGEHGYWGHGRNLYEQGLRIPLSITWKGRLAPRAIDSPALILDVAPTVLGLLAADEPASFEGIDWSAVFRGAPAPTDRRTYYQAHRGAVMSKHESDLARRSGLLEVGTIHGTRKETFRVGKNRLHAFDLSADPGELNDLSRKGETPSEMLLVWMRTVYDGLVADDASLPEPLDEESIDALRSLGYVE